MMGSTKPSVSSSSYTLGMPMTSVQNLSATSMSLTTSAMSVMFLKRPSNSGRGSETVSIIVVGMSSTPHSTASDTVESLQSVEYSYGSQ